MTLSILTPSMRKLVPLLALCIIGCAEEKPFGLVSGTVKYKGIPLRAGNVNFLSTTGAAAIARISDTGDYIVEGSLPAGEYRVYVTPPVSEPGPPGKVVLPKRFDLPSKFQDPATSGETVVVKEGVNNTVIELKD